MTFPIRRVLTTANPALLRRIATQQARRSNSTVALNQLETRWPKLPECEQGAIADSLAAAQKGDWKKMTLEEKRAAYWIAYGNYGARSPRDPAMNLKVAGWSAFWFGVATVVWIGWRTFVVPDIRTMTPEWKEAEARYQIENKMNPHTGPYAEYRKKLEAEEAKAGKN